MTAFVALIALTFAFVAAIFGFLVWITLDIRREREEAEHEKDRRRGN